jgi:hypothetical protein
MLRAALALTLLPTTAPAMDLTLTPTHAQPGDLVEIRITTDMPNEHVIVGVSGDTAPDALCPPVLSGACIDLQLPVTQVFSGTTDASGTRVLSVTLPNVPDGAYNLQAVALRGATTADVSPLATLSVQPMADITFESYPNTTALEQKLMTADAEGHHVATYDVDPTAITHLRVPVGGYVTLASRWDGQRSLYTTAGVQDGDTIQYASPGGTIGTIEVAWPGSVPGATSYTASSGRYGHHWLRFPNDTDIGLHATAPSVDDTLDVLLRAGGTPDAFAWATDVPVTGTGANRHAVPVFTDWVTNPGLVRHTVVNDLPVERYVNTGPTSTRSRTTRSDSGWGDVAPGSSLVHAGALPAGFFGQGLLRTSTDGEVGDFFQLSEIHVPLGALPADGTTRDVTTNLSSLPALPNAVVDLAATSVSHDVDLDVGCLGQPVDLAHVWLESTHTDGTYISWQMLSEADTTLVMPEIDPALAPLWWAPTTLDYLEFELLSVGMTWDAYRNSVDAFDPTSNLFQRSDFDHTACLLGVYK